jgi:hypothetical protein
MVARRFVGLAAALVVLASSALLGIPGTASAEASSTVWSVVPSPDQGSNSYLDSVSCVSSADCVAAGYSSKTSTVDTLIETWNGTSWSVTPSANEVSSNDTLLGVSCSSPSNCMAVGDYQPEPGGEILNLAEVWNGTTWSLTTTPSPGSSSNFLRGVSCVSDSDCVAAGYYISGSSRQTLIETWNGTTWSMSVTPNQGDDDQLLAVSCSRTRNCKAVGSYLKGPALQTLVETLNKSGWSITPSPSPSGRKKASLLDGVSCTSIADCVAIGSYNHKTQTLSLVEMWNGTSWSVIPSPDPSAQNNDPRGVSCVDDTDCTAVGVYYNGSDTGQTFVETWDGSTWSTTSSPNVGTEINGLGGVACVDTAYCVAVGSYANGTDPVTSHTLVESGSISQAPIRPARSR